LEIWAELRSPLARPIGEGRRHNVQPDYTVRVGSTAFMLVECKQYLRAATRRFIEVIKDYTRSSPTAFVILVNYGPAEDSIIPRRLARRATVIGDFRPLSLALGETSNSVGQRAKRTSGSLAQFRECVCTLIQAHCPNRAVASDAVQDEPNWYQVSAAVELVWRDSPRDLDLHILLPLATGAREIDFQSVGTLATAPFAELSGDVLVGRGPETILIDKAVPGYYRVLVHAYSDDGTLASSGAVVTLTWRGHLQRFACPPKGKGSWWVVGDINFVTSESRSINKLSTHKPDAAT
jgi:hypothetical protein